VPPCEGIAPKNYHVKGYQPLLDSQQSIFSRFEDHDQPNNTESKAATLARLKKQKIIDHLLSQKKEIKLYNLESDKNIKGDPRNTIFIGKLSYLTDEKKLEEHFSIYGSIKRIRIVRDVQSNKSRGYAFIEYQERR